MEYSKAGRFTLTVQEEALLQTLLDETGFVLSRYGSPTIVMENKKIRVLVYGNHKKFYKTIEAAINSILNMEKP
jgi:hypothetical protein